jgi:hypothetical protein
MQPVASGGAGAASVTCETYPQFPVYFDPAYESAWTTFIAAAITQFSFGNSPLAANVGYLRFATGGGAEALIPPGINDGGACQNAWATAGYTYAVWNAHEARIITAMGSVSTDKQIMVSLGQAPGGPNVYDVSNQAAAVALSKKVGYSFENLGMGNVATAGTTPAPCSTTCDAGRAALVPGLHERRRQGAVRRAADHRDDEYHPGDDGHRRAARLRARSTTSRSSSSIRRNG